jgi:hypothetical protein
MAAPSSGGDSSSSGFGLTEAESLQILNLMPKQAVEIHLMVDELHSRLSDARQQELLDVIASYKKQPPEEGMAKLSDEVNGEHGSNMQDPVIKLETTMAGFSDVEDDDMMVVGNGILEDMRLKTEETTILPHDVKTKLEDT